MEIKPDIELEKNTLPSDLISKVEGIQTAAADLSERVVETRKWMDEEFNFEQHGGQEILHTLHRREMADVFVKLVEELNYFAEYPTKKLKTFIGDLISDPDDLSPIDTAVDGLKSNMPDITHIQDNLDDIKAGLKSWALGLHPAVVTLLHPSDRAREIGEWPSRVHPNGGIGMGVQAVRLMLEEIRDSGPDRYLLANQNQVEQAVFRRFDECAEKFPDQDPVENTKKRKDIERKNNALSQDFNAVAEQLSNITLTDWIKLYFRQPQILEEFDQLRRQLVLRKDPSPKPSKYKRLNRPVGMELERFYPTEQAPEIGPHILTLSDDKEVEILVDIDPSMGKLSGYAGREIKSPPLTVEENLEALRKFDEQYPDGKSSLQAAIHVNIQVNDLNLTELKRVLSAWTDIETDIISTQSVHRQKSGSSAAIIDAYDGNSSLVKAMIMQANDMEELESIINPGGVKYQSLMLYIADSEKRDKKRGGKAVIEVRCLDSTWDLEGDGRVSDTLDLLTDWIEYSKDGNRIPNFDERIETLREHRDRDLNSGRYVNLSAGADVVPGPYGFFKPNKESCISDLVAHIEGIQEEVIETGYGVPLERVDHRGKISLPD